MPSDGVTPVRPTFLPYSAPSIGEEEINEVLDTLRSGFLSAGPKVRRFEQDFCRYIGARHAIAVNSCTTALQLALAALDVGPGDEVIVPSITFCATANVVEHLGARPVLVDVDENLQISPEATEAAISARTRAIIPVHYGGQACDLTTIMYLANRHGLEVVEDAAHAVGADYQGKKIGNCGSQVAAFSFYPSKNMTTGEGGMLTTEDDGLAARLRELALHGIRRNVHGKGQENRFWDYEVHAAGYKANMPEMAAALGIQQLRKLESFLSRRRAIAKYYSEAFGVMDEVILPGDLPGRPHAYHLYALRIVSRAFDRDRFMQHLQGSNISASVHFIPLHRHPYYSGKYKYPPGQFATADRVFPQIVCLPIYPRMSDEDVDDVIRATREGIYRARASA